MPARRITRRPGDLTPAEAAAMLGVSTRTLERLKASRRIGCVMVGRQVFYTQPDIATYVESLRAVGPPERRTG